MLLLSTLIVFLKDAEANPAPSHTGHSGNDFEFIKTIFQGRNISFGSIDKIQELLRHISNDKSKTPSTINNSLSLIDIFKIHFQSNANDSNPSEESTELQKIKNKLAKKNQCYENLQSCQIGSIFLYKILHSANNCIGNNESQIRPDLIKKFMENSELFGKKISEHLKNGFKISPFERNNTFNSQFNEELEAINKHQITKSWNLLSADQKQLLELFKHSLFSFPGVFPFPNDSSSNGQSDSSNSEIITISLYFDKKFQKKVYKRYEEFVNLFTEDIFNFFRSISKNNNILCSFELFSWNKKKVLNLKRII